MKLWLNDYQCYGTYKTLLKNTKNNHTRWNRAPSGKLREDKFTCTRQIHNSGQDSHLNLHFPIGSSSMIMIHTS